MIGVKSDNALIWLFPNVVFAGTSKAAEPYKVGKRTTEIMVEILNLDKTEIISIDTISNQEFTEVIEFNRLKVLLILSEPVATCHLLKLLLL